MKTPDPQDVASQLAEPPGTSAFRVKGIAYLGHLDYCRRFLPGGTPRFLAALPEPLRPFFGQAFLPGDWYDVFPLAVAGFLCAELSDMSFDAFIQMRAVLQAREDVKGVYRVFFVLFSTRSIAAKLPKLLAQYFNFGEIHILRSESRQVEVERRGVPARIVRWQNGVLRGYLEVVLEMAGARNPRVVFGEPQTTGEAGVHELVTVPTTLAWD